MKKNILQQFPLKIKAKRAALAERTDGVLGQRLTVGLITFGLFIGSQIFKGHRLELIALFIGLPTYIYYIFRSRSFRRLDSKLQALDQFYSDRLALAEGRSLPTEPHESFPDSDLSRDLDLNEIFSHIDTSITLQGQMALKESLCGQSSEEYRQQKKNDILLLGKYPGWLRKLNLQGLFLRQENDSPQNPTEKIDLDTIQTFLSRPITEGAPVWRWILIPLWIIAIASIFTSPVDIAKWLYFIYLGSTLYYIQTTAGSFSKIQELVNSFTGLMPILKMTQKKSGSWKDRFPKLCDQEPSRKLGKLKTSLNLMSVQGNPILFFILNGLFPWSLFVREHAEKKRLNVAESFPSWSQEVADLDSSCALALFWYYQTRTFGEIGTSLSLSFKDLAHPLIADAQVITNDFEQNQSSGFLITGSNMSGKSTFMRAIGINFCLARMGAPVFASQFKAPDCSIASCIRVSDSLRDGQSYFFAEVQRLKKVLDSANSEKIFFLIDEPLRGTNNKERFEGNTEYLQNLLKTGALGFLCTHDLEMTKLSETVEGITNYHFTDTWKDENLYFDYKIRSGPSRTTNALKILRKEGVIR